MWWLDAENRHLSNIDGLVQKRRKSSALAMKLHISCTNPSIWYNIYMVNFDLL